MGEALVGRLVGPSGFSNLVVVKRLLPQYAMTPEFRAMFVDEANLLSRMRHSGIVRVIEFGEDQGELFLVLEYLEGGTLGELLKLERRRGVRGVPATVAIDAIEQASVALHAAHSAADADGTPLKIVHRDVSPQNMFVQLDGAIRIIDFGIASATVRQARTATDQIKGKLAYLAPERLMSADPADHRADIFALGAVLFELVTGRRAFAKATDVLTIRAVVEEPPPSLEEHGFADLEPVLGPILERCLARDPEDRYETCAELAEALRRARRALSSHEESLALIAERAFGESCRIKRVAFESGVASTVPEASTPAEHTDTRPVRRPREDATGSSEVAERPTRARGRRIAAGVVVVLGVATAIGWWATRDEPVVRASDVLAPSPDLPSASGSRNVEAPPSATEPRSADESIAPDAGAATAARLRITVEPASATIRLGGRDLGGGSATVDMPRDPVVLEVRRAGFVTSRRTIDPAETDQDVRVRLRRVGRPGDSRSTPDLEDLRLR
jgi:serine/threonine-protein kinase